MPNKKLKIRESAHKSSPGSTLISIIETGHFSQHVVEILKLIVADLRTEYFESLKQGRKWQAQWVRVRYAYSFALALGLIKLFSWRSLMNFNGLVQNTSLTLVLALGFLGGTILVLSSLFLAPGKGIIIPYAIFLIGVAIVIKTKRITSYIERCIIGTGAFMVTTLALYLSILIVQTPNALMTIQVWGHAWRMGLMLLLGSTINLAVVRILD